MKPFARSTALTWPCLAVGFLAFATASARAADAKLPARPNILFLFSDDQRWDTIAALGNKEVQTPNLDRLVERGFHFNNVYCMGSMIGAVCLPSRTMLMTGQSLWRCPQKMRTKTAPPGAPLLPKLLNEAGYATFHCGKAGNSCTFANTAFTTSIETKTTGPNDAKIHADHAIRFLEKHKGDRPFFLYLAPPVPHDPRIAPPRFMKLYDPTKLTLSKNFLPRHPFDNGELNVRDEKLAPTPRTADAMRRHLADYYASVSNLDCEVGRILEALRKGGFTDNTIVVFSSDQGLAVGGRHGLMGKQNLYEHVKPPLIFAGPGVPHGQSDALVYLFDLFPTFCDLTGVKTPAAVEGRSLLPVIQGKKAKVRDWLFGAYKGCQRMVRDDRWKLIKYNAGGVKNVQLFDLKDDPDEVRNLAGDPGSALQRARMEKLLAAARKELGDPVDFDGKGGEAKPAK